MVGGGGQPSCKLVNRKMTRVTHIHLYHNRIKLFNYLRKGIIFANKIIFGDIG